MIVIDWLNANAGLVTAIATAIIAVSAGITVWLTRNLARENRLLREAGTEPKVVAYCWQPAKLAHFETREIRGLIEV